MSSKKLQVPVAPTAGGYDSDAEPADLPDARETSDTSTGTTGDVETGALLGSLLHDAFACYRVGVHRTQLLSTAQIPFQLCSDSYSAACEAGSARMHAPLIRSVAA